jgi:hypothetical protein
MDAENKIRLSSLIKKSAVSYFRPLPAFLRSGRFSAVSLSPPGSFVIRKVWFNTPPQTCLPQICALCGGSSKATPTKISY